MSLLKFILFSSLEYFSSFIFILIQFRFSLRENIGKIFLISILLSFVSYSFIEADLLGISPLVQNIIFLLYIWMVLKVSLPNSLVMLITGYTVFGLVQSCYAAVFYQIGFIEGVIEMGTNTAYTLSICSSLTMLVLGAAVVYLKAGFSFIETRGRVTKKKKSLQYKLFVCCIILAFFVTLLSSVYILQNSNPRYMLVASILLVVLMLIFYLTFKRDESSD